MPLQHGNSGSMISLRCGQAPTVQMQSRWVPGSRLWAKWKASGQIPSIKLAWNQGLLVFQPSRSHVHMCSCGSRDTMHAEIHIASVVLNRSDMHRVTSKINRLISFETGENASHIFMGSSQRSCVHSNSISAQIHLSLLFKLDRCNMPSSSKNRDKTTSNET